MNHRPNKRNSKHSFGVPVNCATNTVCRIQSSWPLRRLVDEGDEARMNLVAEQVLAFCKHHLVDKNKDYGPESTLLDARRQCPVQALTAGICTSYNMHYTKQGFVPPDTGHLQRSQSPAVFQATEECPAADAIKNRTIAECSGSCIGKLLEVGARHLRGQSKSRIHLLWKRPCAGRCTSDAHEIGLPPSKLQESVVG